MEDKKLQDIGLLVLRVGVGVLFIIHGWPKMFGGPETWAVIGKMGMGAFGINFAPAFWGFMAAFAELIGGIALIAGILTRPFCILLGFTMLAATWFNLFTADGGGKNPGTHALLGLVVFIALLISGPGKYSLRQMVDPFKRKWFV
ncbi:MAG: DoxX family protein [Lentisphaeria bacterium]